MAHTMHEQGKLGVGHLGETAGVGEFDALAAALRLFRRFRARPGSRSAAWPPLRRLPHDLQGDVAAHREAGERETRRRGGQNPARDGRDGVVRV